MDAVAGADDVVLVGQSSGGFVVPLVAHRRGALLQVFVAGMVPQPGESAGEWFGHVGWSDAVDEQAREDGGLTGSPDPLIAFYHDVPADLPVGDGEGTADERATREPPGRCPRGRMSRPSTS